MVAASGTVTPVRGNLVRVNDALDESNMQEACRGRACFFVSGEFPCS